MARTKGSLFSLNAHGSIARGVTYRQGNSKQSARKYAKPTNAGTPKQRERRRITEFIVAQWQNISEATRDTWRANEEAKRLGLTGYQYFLKQAQADLYTYHGLIAYWSMNYIISGEILDLSGNDNTGTLKPTYPTDCPVLTKSKDNRFCNAIEFDGADDYISLETSDSLNQNLNEMTMEVWVNFEESLTEAILVALSIDNWKKAVTIRNAQRDVQISFYVDGASRTITSNSKLERGIWNQITGTYDGTNINIYLNGVLDKSHGPYAPPITDFGSPSYIGTGLVSQGFFPGKLDEICVYNRALSAEEIATRYKFAMKKTER